MRGSDGAGDSHERDDGDTPWTAALLADYSSAVVHLALNRNGSTKRRTLLFAWVELLPNEMPPPMDDYEDAPKAGYRVDKQNNHLHVRHAVVPSSWALGWYAQSCTGRVVWPRDGDFAQEPDQIADVLETSPLSQEPRWPRLVTHSEKTTALPFVGEWADCPRAHHLIPAEQMDLRALWEDRGRSCALTKLSELLHFDAAHHPELWGSVHLIAPNPVYRSLASRLRTREDGDSVLLRFRARRGASLEGLSLRFQERVPWGPREDRVIRATPGTTSLSFEHPLAGVREEVLDAERGLLRVGDQEFGFVRSIGLATHLAEPAVVSSTARNETFAITRTGEAMQSVLGAPVVVGPAERRMSEAWHARKARALAKEGGDQLWFRGQRREAHEAVVARIQRANRHVMLADPYFGPDELFFAEAVGRSGATVRILTARNVEENRDAKNGTPPSEWLWTEFASRLQDVQGRLRHNPVRVRVLGAKTLHDRFLVTDGKVWSVGGSFNNLGDRGSLLVSLKDPESMRGILDALWAAARPLEDVVSARGSE